MQLWQWEGFINLINFFSYSKGVLVTDEKLNYTI